MPRWRVCHARRPPGGAGAAGSHSRPAQKIWSLPHGVVRGREFATSSRTRTGGRVVGSRHLNSRRPIGYGHFSLSPRIQLISVRSPPNSRANLLACAGRLDVLGREVSWGRRAWWSRAAVKPPLRQEYSRPAQKMWSLPHGACVAGSRPPVLTPAREGVSWTHDTSPWALASGAEPIPMDRLPSLPLMTLRVLSSRRGLRTAYRGRLPRRCGE